jgi:hypothetical protein
MAVTFPSLTPTSRSFSAPSWPITKIDSQSGVSTTRLWGNIPSKAALTLSFDNISDDNAALIMQAYTSANGSLIDLTLPNTIFAGASATLKNWISVSSVSAQLKWYFSNDQPVSIESVVNGRSSVRVSLVAEIRLQ